MACIETGATGPTPPRPERTPESLPDQPRSNRIPDPLGERLARAAASGASEQASVGRYGFDDRLRVRDSQRAEGWITVAERWREPGGLGDDRRTFSYLVELDELEVNLRCDQGIIATDADPHIVATYLTPGRVKGPFGPGTRPFVLHRGFHGYRPTEMEFVQAFIAFWNGWWDSDGVLRRIDDDGQVHEVARRVPDRENPENQRLEADACHLRRFLQEAKSALIRQHDHRRFSATPLPIDDDELTRTYHESDAEFFIHVRNDDLLMTMIRALGRVIGKDVVMPYAGTPAAPPERFEHFIIARDERGSEIGATCDESSLSNYSTDRGTPHFLTPVLFRAEVLRKYYDDPQRFTVTSGFIKCLDLWAIDYERHDGYVQVYLGDLGRIPYVEQQYWRSFNVPPRGGISEARFARDFLAQWRNPTGDPLFDFTQALRDVNAASRVVFGQDLYRPLEASDEHVLTSLHVPLADSPVEADAEITKLVKITVESLDNDLLRRLVPAGVDVAGKRSGRLLEAVLTGWGIANVVDIVGPHDLAYYLRAHGSAHRRGSDWEKTLERNGLVDVSYKELVVGVMAQLTVALRELRTAIEQRGAGAA